MTFWYKFFYAIFWLIYRVIFHRIYTEGYENIPEGPVIICGNHTNTDDPVVVTFSLMKPEKLYYMAKKELFSIPVLGCFIRMAGAFPVDRGQADLGSIRMALRHLYDGHKLVIFPEGHRVSDNMNSEAKNGAIMLAARTGVPIIPVFMPRKRTIFSKITVRYGEPYKIEIDRKDRNSETYAKYADELMKKIHSLNPEGQVL